MKHIKLVIVFCLTFMLCSCGLFSPQEYVCEESNVNSVQIVVLDDYVEEEYRFEYTTLSEISDLPAFIKQLNSVKHSVNWGEPGVLFEGYVVIKINYTNGDYDLLYPNAQWFNREGKNQTGYFFFDAEQFDKLIAKWCPDTSTEDSAMPSDKATK